MPTPKGKARIKANEQKSKEVRMRPGVGNKLTPQRERERERKRERGTTWREKERDLSNGPTKEQPGEIFFLRHFLSPSLLCP